MLKDGKPAGYGFVCFSTPGQASDAIIKMNDKQIGNGKLVVKLRLTKEEVQAQKQSVDQQFHAIRQREDSNLYVGNLDVKIFNYDYPLHKEFESFGKIISAKV